MAVKVGPTVDGYKEVKIGAPLGDSYTFRVPKEKADEFVKAREEAIKKGSKNFWNIYGACTGLGVLGGLLVKVKNTKILERAAVGGAIGMIAGTVIPILTAIITKPNNAYNIEQQFIKENS